MRSLAVISRAWFVVPVITVAALTGLSDVAPSDAAAAEFPKMIVPLGPGARLGASLPQLERALLLPPLEVDLSQPVLGTAPATHTRGPGQALYPKVAPSVVVVRTPFGHGSGFLIGAGGWVITNHHVIDATATDFATGAAAAQVYLGHMNGQLMEVEPSPVPALVYKASETQDLALLKLMAPAGQPAAYPGLTLSSSPAAPGTTCFAVGHPAAGLLWTLRECEVNGVGEWPSEHIDVRMWRLRASTDEEMARLSHLVAQIPKRRVVLSSCGINPGDSGGPLVNERGEVIAVTFAIPPDGLDHFSYHIDLKELRAFTAERPSAPALRIPEAWPSAAAWELRDCDRNGKSETLVFGMANGQVSGILCDLDEDTSPDSAAAAAFQPGPGAWDFEFALQPVPEPRTFYDRDNDGTVDLVRIEGSGESPARVAMEQQNGVWKLVPGAGALIDPALVSAPLRDRYVRVITSLSAPSERTQR